MTDAYRAHLERIPQYFRQAVDTELPVLEGDVLVCGMGGSGISGLLAEAVEPRGVVAWNDYNPPVSQVDAAIAISYSGNTEETLSCYNAVKKQGLPVVAVTSGGKLEEHARKNGDAVVNVPSGLPPRAALPFLLTPVLRIINDNYTAAVEQVSARLEQDSEVLQAWAERLAEKCAGKTPVMYAPRELYPAAYRVKTQVNENAKQHAFAHVLPEAFHNEIVAYESGNDGFFPVFLLRNGFEKADRMAELIGVPYEILRMDTPLLDALLQYVYLGDWFSYFLAERNDVNPVPVNIIEKLKGEPVE